MCYVHVYGVVIFVFVFFFKQKTAYDMRISDWSSDVALPILPVLNTDGSVALDHEEFPRPETTAEGLASLKPAFTGLADFDLGGGFTFRKQVNRRYPDVEIQHFHQDRKSTRLNSSH